MATRAGCFVGQIQTMHAGEEWEESMKVCDASWDVTPLRMLAWGL